MAEGGLAWKPESLEYLRNRTCRAHELGLTLLEVDDETHVFEEISVVLTEDGRCFCWGRNDQVRSCPSQ